MNINIVFLNSIFTFLPAHLPIPLPLDPSMFSQMPRFLSFFWLSNVALCVCVCVCVCLYIMPLSFHLPMDIYLAIVNIHILTIVNNTAVYIGVHSFVV